MIQITKEELGEIIDLTEQMCNLDGWVKEALPLAQRRMDIITLASARPHTPTKSVSLTAIEIALRKDDCPSKSVQWAIEKINQYQENQEQHDTAIRNAILDDLIETTEEDFIVDFDDNYVITYGDFLFNVESLRTPTTKEHP